MRSNKNPPCRPMLTAAGTTLGGENISATSARHLCLDLTTCIACSWVSLLRDPRSAASPASHVLNFAARDACLPALLCDDACHSCSSSSSLAMSAHDTEGFESRGCPLASSSFTPCLSSSAPAGKHSVDPLTDLTLVSALPARASPDGVFSDLNPLPQHLQEQSAGASASIRCLFAVGPSSSSAGPSVCPSLPVRARVDSTSPSLC